VSFEGELAFEYQFPAGEIPYPAPPKKYADFSAISARGWARGHAQLHRRGSGKQLRGAYRRLIATSFDNEKAPVELSTVCMWAFPHGEGCRSHHRAPDNGSASGAPSQACWRIRTCFGRDSF